MMGNDLSLMILSIDMARKEYVLNTEILQGRNNLRII